LLRTPARSLSRVNAARPLIAIVDDEESVRRALGRLMMSAGYRARVFSSGAEFLTSLATDRPSCVILDLHMPGLSGFELQGRLRDAPQPLPVVVITGHDTPEAQKRAQAGGAVAYLRKPVDDQLLLDAVTRAIDAGTQKPAPNGA
jgi:FixJ family two-component response regulator